MKRNIKIIITLFLVLILLLGGYFLAYKWQPAEEEQESNEGLAYTETEFALSVNTEDISFVEINTANSSYTVRNGNPVTVEGYSSHIMDSYKLSTVIYNASNIVISKRLEDYTGNLSDYGLENPDKSVVVSMKNGVFHSLLIGNSTNFDGEYYAKLEGEDSVFTLSSYSVDMLMKEPSDLRSLNICSISSDTTVSVTVTKKGQKELTAKYDKNFVPTNEYVKVSYLITYPYDNVAASLDALGPLLKSITPLTADSIVEENPKNLSLYGLDKPYELEVTDVDGKTTRVKAGSYGDNGAVYLMCNDIPVVYLARCPFYEIIKEAKAEDYVEKFIHLFNINDVEKITVKDDSKEYTLSTEDYKINDNTVTEENFKRLYQLIIGITAADFTNETVAGKEKCTVTFNFSSGEKKEFIYRIYNDRYSMVKADNGIVCLTLTKNLDSILNELE